MAKDESGTPTMEEDTSSCFSAAQVLLQNPPHGRLSGEPGLTLQRGWPCGNPHLHHLRGSAYGGLAERHSEGTTMRRRLRERGRRRRLRERGRRKGTRRKGEKIFICPGREGSRAKGPFLCHPGPIEGAAADVSLKWPNQKNWGDVYPLPALRAT